MKRMSEQWFAEKPSERGVSLPNAATQNNWYWIEPVNIIGYESGRNPLRCMMDIRGVGRIDVGAPVEEIDRRLIASTYWKIARTVETITIVARGFVRPSLTQRPTNAEFVDAPDIEIFGKE